MNTSTQQHILLRSPNWLGDIILCQPAVTALRRALPGARVTVLVRQSMARLWEMTPVDSVIAFTCAAGPAGLRDRWQVARELKQRAFESALIFPNSFDAALVPFLARIPERVGWPAQGRGLLLNHRILYPRHLDSRQQPERDLYLVSRWLGEELPLESDIRLAIPEPDRTAIAEQRAGMAERIIGLNPGAAYGPAKCWLPERYALTALQAHAALASDVIITGSAGDAAVCEQVFNTITAQDPQAVHWCRNLAGGTSISAAAAWLEQCDCLVTNDTGGMHLAAAVGTPVVAVFGPTDWHRTAPLGEGHVLIKAGEQCDKRCKRVCVADQRCMKSITVDMVMAGVEKVIHGG